MIRYVKGIQPFGMNDDGAFTAGIEDELQRFGGIYFHINDDDVVEELERNRDFLFFRIKHIGFRSRACRKAEQAAGNQDSLYKAYLHTINLK